MQHLTYSPPPWLLSPIGQAENILVRRDFQITNVALGEEIADVNSRSVIKVTHSPINPMLLESDDEEDSEFDDDEDEDDEEEEDEVDEEVEEPKSKKGGKVSVLEGKTAKEVSISPGPTSSTPPADAKPHP
jgi:FK506-binding nuclear protein